MQDFTKPVAINNNPVTQANTSSEKWLNKDRIWNFVFWLGMSGGFTVSAFVKKTFGMSALSSFIFWSTLVVIPLMVTLATKTKFIKKDTFANSDGRIITKKQMPYSFVLATIVGIGFTVGVAEVVSSKNNHLFTEFLLCLSLFSGFSLYFIFKNCPISILFNYKMWALEPYSGRSSTANYHSPSSSSSNHSPINYVTNPTYGSLNSNIYNKHR